MTRGAFTTIPLSSLRLTLGLRLYMLTIVLDRTLDWRVLSSVLALTILLCEAPTTIVFPPSERKKRPLVKRHAPHPFLPHKGIRKATTLYPLVTSPKEVNTASLLSLLSGRLPSTIRTFNPWVILVIPSFIPFIFITLTATRPNPTLWARRKTNSVDRTHRVMEVEPYFGVPAYATLVLW